MAQTNDDLIKLARQGNETPLLDKLKSGKVKTSGTKATSENDRGDPPDDTLWYTVLDAHGNGELSDETFKRCHDAVRAGYVK